MSLVALLISNLNPPNLIYHYSNSAMKKDLTSDSKLIVSKAKSLRLNIGSRQKLNSDYGTWYVTKDEKDLIYAACVSEDYPQRVIFGLFQKMQTTIKQKNNGGDLQKIISKSKKQLNEVCQKYKDSRVDKVRQAQLSVKQLKDQLHIGIGKILQNQDNINHMNQKAVLMKNYAKEFQKGAEQVERKMFCHKWKIYIIVGGSIASVLIASGLVIYLQSH